MKTVFHLQFHTYEVKKRLSLVQGEANVSLYFDDEHEVNSYTLFVFCAVFAFPSL